MPATSTLGADTLGEHLFDTLGESIDIPAVDLSDVDFQIEDDPALQREVSTLTIDDLTTTEVGGTGAFDKLMTANRNHIVEELQQGRITAAEFSTAYVAMTTAALGSAVQFLLARDQAYWTAVAARSQAKQANIEAVTARVNFETAKANLNLVTVQAATAEGQLALVKMQLANEDIKYAIQDAQRKAAIAQFSDTLPDGTAVEGIIGRQNIIADEEIETKRAQTIDTRRDGTGITGILGSQKQVLAQQVVLAAEQVEAKRAETLDTRTDGAAVKGTVGKQKDLYSQQIESYQQDAAYKVGKIFSDAWITQKTIDGDLAPPTNFTNAEFDKVLDDLRVGVNLD